MSADPGRPPGRALGPLPGKAPVLFRCRECGAGLLLAPAEARRRKFCSRACVARAQRAGRFPLPPGHRTAEGKARSLQNLARAPEARKEWWAAAAHRWASCRGCGASFPTRATSPPRFCSARCWKRDADARGLYKVGRACAACGATFAIEPWKPGRCCSKSCAKRLWWAERRAPAAPPPGSSPPGRG